MISMIGSHKGMTPEFTKSEKRLSSFDRDIILSLFTTKMKALWDELTSYHDPVACSCEGVKFLGEREEKERVM